jgi:hypothetical protein
MLRYIENIPDRGKPVMQNRFDGNFMPSAPEILATAFNMEKPDV